MPAVNFGCTEHAYTDVNAESKERHQVDVIREVAAYRAREHAFEIGLFASKMWEHIQERIRDGDACNNVQHGGGVTMRAKDALSTKVCRKNQQHAEKRTD